MRIVFIGDIFGRSGREALQTYMPKIMAEIQPDVVIVNGENAAAGRGITEKIAKEFFEWGVDVITSGNHIWDQREVIAYIDREERLLRPINYPKGTPGKGLIRYACKNGQQITIVNAMARLFMDTLDDPFAIVKEVVENEQLGQKTDAIFIDFHGEATSEKMSLASYLDGQITALVGTHTHIPTADTHVMAGGTAYQSDAGMTGDYNSVIGVVKEIATHKFVKKFPGEHMKAANGEATLCGCLIVSDDNTGLAQSIEPFQIGGILSERWPF